MDKTLEQALRVDHAGELGAVRIYQGQMRVLKNKPIAKDLAHMAQQEQVHFDTFKKILPEYNVRPTALQPLWNIGAYGLGVVTGLMGEKAAHACTEAVETVIDEHYQEQIDALQESQPELAATFKKFQEEELEHKQQAIDGGAHDAPAYPMLSAGIQGITRLAIAVSKRV